MDEKEKERLRKILKRLKGKNSQEWLAKELGASTFAVRSWIVGTATPDTESLSLIANYMDISTGDLISQIQGTTKKEAFPTTAEEGYGIISNLPKTELIQIIRYILDDLEH